MHGVITEVVDHGTIVQVLVCAERGQIWPVNFDHRMFRDVVEARGPARIVGQAVTVERRETGETLVLDDEES